MSESKDVLKKIFTSKEFNSCFKDGYICSPNLSLKGNSNFTLSNKYLDISNESSPEKKHTFLTRLIYSELARPPIGSYEDLINYVSSVLDVKEGKEHIFSVEFSLNSLKGSNFDKKLSEIYLLNNCGISDLCIRVTSKKLKFSAIFHGYNGFFDHKCELVFKHLFEVMMGSILLYNQHIAPHYNEFSDCKISMVDDRKMHLGFIRFTPSELRFFGSIIDIEYHDQPVSSVLINETHNYTEEHKTYVRRQQMALSNYYKYCCSTPSEEGTMFYLVMAFEALFGSPKGEPQKVKDLVEKISYFVSESLDDIEENKEILLKLFNYRNDIIHGNIAFNYIDGFDCSIRASKVLIKCLKKHITQLNISLEKPLVSNR